MITDASKFSPKLNWTFMNSENTNSISCETITLIANARVNLANLLLTLTKPLKYNVHTTRTTEKVATRVARITPLTSASNSIEIKPISAPSTKQYKRPNTFEFLGELIPISPKTNVKIPLKDRPIENIV